MFAESKDEIALILVGTDETDNPLANGECYEHISIANPMGIVDFDFLQLVQNDVKASSTAGDCILILCLFSLTILNKGRVIVLTQVLGSASLFG
jgi:hypothetical protein